MKMKETVKCGMHKDCFAYDEGECTILKDTDFGKRDCPFYKKHREDVRGKEDG